MNDETSRGAPLECGPEGGGPYFLDGVPVEDAAQLEVRHEGGWLRGAFQATIKRGSRNRLIVETSPGTEPLEILLPADAVLRWPIDEQAPPQ